MNMQRLVLSGYEEVWIQTRCVTSVSGEETGGKLGFPLPFPSGLAGGETASITVSSLAARAGLSQLEFAYKILQQIHHYLWCLQ